MNKIGYCFFRIGPKLHEYFYKYWNRLYFYLIGIKYGKNLIVNNKVYIRGTGEVRIGNDFRFTSSSGINPICRNIRGEFYLGKNTAKIIIGDNVGISSSCLWANECIIIGNNVLVGGDSLIIDTDAHSHNYVERRKGSAPLNGEYKIVPTAPIVIEDDVWIGARCQILKGVHIGARSIIAAGSVITKDIPSDCVAGGSPCKVIRKKQQR